MEKVALGGIQAGNFAAKIIIIMGIVVLAALGKPY
jgi:hypothetical protein